MTYRNRCRGRKGRIGRRTVNLGHPPRTNPWWVRVLGTVKLRDRQIHAMSVALEQWVAEHQSAEQEKKT